MRGNGRSDEPLDQSAESFTMVVQRASTATACFGLLVTLFLVHKLKAQQWAQEPEDWQTITNLTVTNSLVNYQIKSFTVDHTTSHQLNLVIQQNDAELVKDMVICDNMAYTIDPTKIYIQPLNARLFNQVGLYVPKVLYQFSETVLNTKKSIAYDWARQVLFFTHQARIEALNFCKSFSKSQVIISGDQDTQITHLAVDSAKGALLWVESTDIDHYRIMMASVEGEHVTTLHESNSSQCAAMTVFTDAGLVYWVTRQQLWSVPYSSPGQVRMVLHNENLITDSIQVDHHHLYWSSMQRKVLRMPIGDSTRNKDKIQLISQLGSQHLLLVSFQVTSLNADQEEAGRCVPLCQTPHSNKLSVNNATGAITEVTPQSAVGNSIWTEVRNFDWKSPKQVTNFLVTGLLVLAVNTSLVVIFVCLRPRQRI